VKERLGHGSLTTTQKYLHTLPGAHDAALTALETVRGRRARDEGDSGSPGDARDAELTHLRETVAKFKELLSMSIC
jgi:hypothetical protein